MAAMERARRTPLARLLIIGAALVALAGFAWGGRTPTAHAEPPDLSNWNKVFDDSFDGDALNTSNWVTCWYWGADSPDGGCSNGANGQISWVLPRNVGVSGGNLELRSVRESYTTPAGQQFQWTNGMVVSDRLGRGGASKFAFQYGYAEVRAKLAPGKGVYSAFWLTAADQNWPPEIDVFEIVGDRPTTMHMTTHYNDANGQHQGPSQAYTGPDFTADWHTYAVDWEPNVIVWYLDGQAVATAPNISNEPMVINLSNEIWQAGGFTDGADSSTPSLNSTLVDYVRVWQRNPGAPTYTPIPPTSTPISTPTPTTLPAGATLRVDTGSASNYTDSAGHTWLADTGWYARNGGGGGVVDRDTVAVANTTNPRIYQTERWMYGDTGYSFPVANGSYTVRLHFAENYPAITGPGQRVFSVNVAGVPLNDLDIYAETGGRNIALVKTFNVAVTDGVLNIAFAATKESATVDGIEIIPADPGAPTSTSGPPTRTPTVTSTPAPTTPPNTGQLVVNPGFEDGTAPWAPWANGAVVAGNAHSGTYAWQAGDGTSGGVGGGGQTITAGIASNASYTFSVWGKVSDSGGVSTAGVNIYVGDTKTTQYVTFSETSYTQKTITFTTPAGTTKLEPFIWKPSGAAYFYADDFSLQLTDASAPTDTPTSTPTVTPTSTPTATPSSTPTPSNTPTNTPTPAPSVTPTNTPSSGGPNLAKRKPATDSACQPDQEASAAVDGLPWTKWCSESSTPYLIVDLGQNATISQFVIKHAGAGNESTLWNTRDFTIQVRKDGGDWRTVVTAQGNTASTTTHTIKPVRARYVRLNIITPTSDDNPAARIYEFEVH